MCSVIMAFMHLMDDSKRKVINNPIDRNVINHAKELFNAAQTER